MREKEKVRVGHKDFFSKYKLLFFSLQPFSIEKKDKHFSWVKFKQAKLAACKTLLSSLPYSGFHDVGTNLYKVVPIHVSRAKWGPWKFRQWEGKREKREKERKRERIEDKRERGKSILFLVPFCKLIMILLQQISFWHKCRFSWKTQFPLHSLKRREKDSRRERETDRH